jgi:ATP adenylyltransferase
VVVPSLMEGQDMEKLWAPWRMDYILSEKRDGCVFCEAVKEGRDEANLILHRGTYCFVILNRYPYNNGHLMVAPYAHVDTPASLPPEALTEMMILVNRCLDVLHRGMRPDGYNVGMNLGKSAGAGIKDHIHMHIVPRWTGDTNFMPVFSDTRVIVESLEHCYAHLKPLFDS